MQIKNIGLFLVLISLVNCTWLPEVTGYSESDSSNGYAGLIGQAVKAIKVSGGNSYRVHVTGGSWLAAVTKGSCGNGEAIDAIAVKGATYKVHVMGSGWLPAVTGYDTSDANNGYAGVLGKTIDAIAIKGKTYAVCYGSGCGTSDGGSEVSSGKPVSPTNGKGDTKVRDKFVACVKAQLGKPYVYGGIGPNSFDCSGLAYYCFNKEIPRTSTPQATGGKDISKSSVQSGDLLIFLDEAKTDIGHTGISIGNGQMIHAPDVGDVVKITKWVGNPYHEPRLHKVRRYW